MGCPASDDGTTEQGAGTGETGTGETGTGETGTGGEEPLNPTCTGDKVCGDYLIEHPDQYDEDYTCIFETLRDAEQHGGAWVGIDIYDGALHDFVIHPDSRMVTYVSAGETRICTLRSDFFFQGCLEDFDPSPLCRDPFQWNEDCTKIAAADGCP